MQLYVAKPGAEVFRPAQELKGFAKVQLLPGESKTVTIPLDDKASATGTPRPTAGKWKAAAVSCGSARPVRTIRLTAVVEVAGTGAPNPMRASICRTIPAARCRACRMTNGHPAGPPGAAGKS